MSNMAVKGDYVRVHAVVLTPNKRAEHLPENTKSVDLEMWNKGFLLEDEAKIGDKVHIMSITNRRIEGILVEEAPAYTHNFGEFIGELAYIGPQLREILSGGDSNGER